jgi:hypothetical protein
VALHDSGTRRRGDPRADGLDLVARDDHGGVLEHLVSVEQPDPANDKSPGRRPA